MSKKVFKPKKIEDQVIMITGASSGIGLAAAQEATDHGASVILFSRDCKELKTVAEEINAKALGKAISVYGDVRNVEDLIKARDMALAEYGHIDTWINNAATSISGYLMDSDIREERKVFETNFWGTRLGCHLAVDVMKKEGGVIINLGSETSVASAPLLGIYTATKHAIKALTDALRSEIRDRELPIEVCLVRPIDIDTTFSSQPVSSARLAAEAIIKCATSPQRDVYVGGPARLSVILDTFLPKVKDIYAESMMKNFKKAAFNPRPQSPGEVSDSNKGRGPQQNSLYTEVSTLNILKSLGDSVKDTLNDFRKPH
jgi:short-subunit dehydrogenase